MENSFKGQVEKIVDLVEEVNNSYAKLLNIDQSNGAVVGEGDKLRRCNGVSVKC